MAAREEKITRAHDHKRGQQPQALTMEQVCVSNHQSRKWTKTSQGHQALAATESPHRIPVADEECPYGHAKNGPQLAPTVPVFAPFPKNRLSPEATTATTDDPVALLIRQAQMPPAVSVTALADSGASHVLLRRSDAHILHRVEYSQPPTPPFATLKAANGSTLHAIGIGTLHVGKLDLPAYIFADTELTANLLGLAPFCDRNCTVIFTPRTLLIYQDPGHELVMSGHRPTPQSLWSVDLQPHRPHGDVPTHTAPCGMHIAANHIGQQDASSYVKFIHWTSA